jgi:small subunit ribosomal protein S20
VPNSKSAKKRLRQNLRRRERNKAARTRLKRALKKVRTTADGAQAAEAYLDAVRLLDKAAANGLIHRNRAARSKSRLAAQVKRVGGSI